MPWYASVGTNTSHDQCVPGKGREPSGGQLPEEVRALAEKQFRPFRENPFHPSAGFARKGNVWTGEVGQSQRVVARRRSDDVYSHEAKPIRSA